MKMKTGKTVFISCFYDRCGIRDCNLHLGQPQWISLKTWTKSMYFLFECLTSVLERSAD